MTPSGGSSVFPTTSICNCSLLVPTMNVMETDTPYNIRYYDEKRTVGAHFLRTGRANVIIGTIGTLPEQMVGNMRHVA